MTPPEKEDTTGAIIAAGRRLATVALPVRYRHRKAILVALAVVAVAGTIGLYLSRNKSPSPTTAAPAIITIGTDETSTGSLAAQLPSSPQPTSPLPAGTTQNTPVEETLRPTVPLPPATTPEPATTTTVTSTTTTTVFDPTIPGQFPWNYGALVDGILTLNGSITTQEQADLVRQRAVKLLSAQRVVGELNVDPDASGPTGIVRADIDLNFEPQSDVIRAEFHRDLDVAVLILILSPEAKVQVYSYTDSVGDAQQNLDLSTKRVQAIVDYLGFSGVPLERITSFPRGEENPIGDNSTAAGRAKNQRIEFVFTNLFSP